MSTIIYSRQISEAVLNILSLVIFIYLSRSLLSNPFSCFLFYFIFYFVIIGFLTSLFISNFVEIQNDNNEETVIIQQEKVKSEKSDSGKYKILLKKFKNLRKEFRETKNEINDIKNELLISKTTTISDDDTSLSETISDIEINNLNQEFVDNIRDIPDDDILDDIINQTENNFQIIEKH